MTLYAQTNVWLRGSISDHKYVHHIGWGQSTHTGASWAHVDYWLKIAIGDLVVISEA